jgi:PBP1b-binding outer membrane lipoprotein LpoB
MTHVARIQAGLLYCHFIVSINMKKITMALVGGLLFVLCYQHTNRQTDYLKKQEKPAATGSPTEQSAAKVPEEMRNSPLFKLVKA